jgi:hypothetical protein
MGESNDERIARKKRERAEFLKQEAADAAMAAKLDKDPEFAKTVDDVFVTGFRGLEDDIIGKAAKELGFNDKQIQKALEDAQRARKVAKGGFLTNADPEKAAKIVEDNLVLNRIVQKKSKGCAIVGLLFLGSSATAVGGIIWAAGEVLTRVFS